MNLWFKFWVSEESKSLEFLLFVHVIVSFASFVKKMSHFDLKKNVISCWFCLILI